MGPAPAVLQGEGTCCQQSDLLQAVGKFTALKSPEQLIRKIQKRVLDFFLEWKTLDMSPCPVPGATGGRSGHDQSVQSSNGFSSADSTKTALQPLTDTEWSHGMQQTLVDPEPK